MIRFCDNVFVCTSLIDLYGNCKEIECAHKVFDEVTNRIVVSWIAMVVCYVNVGDLAEAKKVFDLMLERIILLWNVLIRRDPKFVVGLLDVVASGFVKKICK